MWITKRDLIKYLIQNGAEQIIKADRLRMSRPLQNSKARATLRRLNSTALRTLMGKDIT